MKSGCILFLFCLQWLVGCTGKKQEQSIIVDFSKPDLTVDTHSKDTVPHLRVAIAAIISPEESYIYYEEMMSYISAQIRRPIQYVQKKTYSEINDQIMNGSIDLAFICTGAYAEPKARSAMDMLVVPVVNGEVFYQSYIITRKNSGIMEFSQLKNRTFAFTDPMSNTGYFYPMNRLKKITGNPEGFFARTLFTHAHDNSIHMVARKVVDAAAVDGLIYEYHKKFHSERVRDIVVIEKSEKYGIPPVVVPKSINHQLKMQLQKIFLELHEHKEGKKILDKLMIDKFVLGNEQNYKNVTVVP